MFFAVYDSKKKKRSKKQALLWRELFSGEALFTLWFMQHWSYLYFCIPSSFLHSSSPFVPLIEWTDWNQESTPKLCVNSCDGKKKKRHIKLEDQMWTITFWGSSLFCYAQNLHILTHRRSKYRQHVSCIILHCDLGNEKSSTKGRY